MSKLLANVVILGAILASSSSAQGFLDQMNFSRSNLEGPHLYGVSANASYSTYDFRTLTGGLIPTNLSSRTNYGVSATAGWQRFHGRTTFSVRYTGGYNGDATYDRNSLQHSLAASLSRALGQRWSFSLSASAMEADLSQSIFEPSTLVVLTQSGATFDDLAAAQSIGQYSSVASGLLLSGGTANSATRALLLGNRVLSYNLNANLNFAYSSRLRFSFGTFTMGGEHRSGDNTLGVDQNYVMPRTIGGSASASMSYSLSPRTDLSLGVAQNYINARYQKSMGTSTDFGIGRKMGRRWFLRGHGGVYMSENVQQSVGKIAAAQATWGGSIGFRTNAHSFVGSYLRSGLELGSAAPVGKNTSLNGSWSWSPSRRGGWSFHASYGRNQTSGTGFLTLTGWQVGAGVNRSLGWNLSMGFSYAYLISRSNFSGLGNEVNVNSARVSLGWAPRLRRAPQGGGAQETDQQ